ncbi:hypothetical protein ACQP2X_33765 [Actinoplanes sp. CA-131856]
MTGPHVTTTNTAADSSTVGVQAGIAVVRELNFYQVLPEDPPERRYEVGVLYLEGRMPQRARELINEAVALGYVSSEVRFHQLLALLSGRTLQQLSNDDFARLEDARSCPTVKADDNWTAGIKMIDRLLANIEASDTDHAIDLAELDTLGKEQSRKITKHLEMFLTGPLEDQAWRRLIREAADGQLARDREQRTWKFFEPIPVGPRRTFPDPPKTTAGVWVRAVTAGVLFAVVAGYIGVLVVMSGHVPAIVAYVLAVAGGYLWAVNGAEWRHRNERLNAKERELRSPRQRRRPPAGGFASRVDRMFRGYFGRYVPNDVDRGTWLAETAGIRRSIRDEVVNAYRDTKVDADAIAWLIRYRVGVVKKQWRQDTLWDHRRRFRTPFSTKAAVVLGVSVLVLAAIRALVSAIPMSPLYASLAVPVLVMTGAVAANDWLAIITERRRYECEREEKELLYLGSYAAFCRWKEKLADAPTDSEMAAWLECDRMLLMRDALQHYKLVPSNMIVHAFIEAPARGCDQARVVKGPWRYSRYQMLVFLLTPDGVRQMAVELDFHHATFHNRERTNYRFDAVASVHVTEGDHKERTFELALVSGQPLEIPVSGVGEEKLGIGEAPGTAADLTVDAAGLQNTLHVLEGIAAEGKDWVAHEDQRSGERIRRLRQAVHGMVD